MTNIRRTTYRGFNGQEGEVLYVIIDGRCTFTTTSLDTTSSINAAERITLAICADEACNEWQLDFFDLQTRLGYDSKDAGHYDYDQVVLGQGICGNPEWIPTPLPDEIRQLFAAQIG